MGTLVGPGSVAWYRGQTSLLRVSQQIHDECADLLYGTNTFLVELTYDRIDFLHRWTLPVNLYPKRTYPFPDHFQAEYLRRMRNFFIHIEHLDSYMGMIKYNCGGDGLLFGVRSQVQKLADVLGRVDQLGNLSVQLGGAGRFEDIKQILSQIRTVQDRRVDNKYDDTRQTQMVLEPLRSLHAAGSVNISGAVTAAYGRLLQEEIMR